MSGRVHYTVLPTKTSLIVQLVHWDVPSFSGFLFFHLFHVLCLVISLGFIAVSMLLISLPYMILFHLCTYKQCAGSNEGLGASLWGLAVTVLYRFLLFLSVSWGRWYHGVHHSLPSFYRGKTAPGGGCSSRGPPGLPF